MRLNFGHAAQNYTVHAAAAERYAGIVLRFRMTMLALLGFTLAAAILGVVRPSRHVEVSAAIAAGLALGAFTVHTALGLEGKVHAHRICAHRLWMVCERHRALLAELQDGLIDRPTLLGRRDELVAEMHAVYEQAFPPDQRAFETLRLTSDGGPLSDEAIDRLLPASLHRHPAAEAG